MVANALTKQIEKELTYIKQLNEREKNMNSHLVRTRKAYDDMDVTKHVSQNVLDRELTTSKMALDMYTQKEEELAETLKELKKIMSVSKEKLAEVSNHISGFTWYDSILIYLSSSSPSQLWTRFNRLSKMRMKDYVWKKTVSS